MSAAKIAITLDERLLRVIDRWVKQGRYPNRSKAVQAAVADKIERWNRTRLAAELEHLDANEERALADESIKGDTWLES